jgi:quercetin dioxygenase-like cupin family protein
MKLAAVVIVAACGHAPVAQPQPQTGSSTSTSTSTIADAPGPSQDEILAAIQKAMNDLATPAHQCWAAAATERFDVEGELQMHVDIAGGTANVAIARDTSNSKRLGACMTTLLAGYRWAPPLANQSFELPFKFTAPDSQSVIDRQLVEWHGQGDVRIAVLLDENNTGNPNGSMLEVAIKSGSTTGNRWIDRVEVWYFRAPARLTLGQDEHAGLVAPEQHDISSGSFVLFRPGYSMEVTATKGDVHAAVAIIPGGREGTARAGALTNTRPKPTKLNLTPRIVTPADAKTYGPATIYLDPAVTYEQRLSATILSLPAGAKVAEHVHAKETELLYILEGAGTMTVAGTDVPVTATSVIQIPPNTKHAFVATAAVSAFQVYTPAGPEQRFKEKKPK